MVFQWQKFILLTLNILPTKASKDIENTFDIQFDRQKYYTMININTNLLSLTDCNQPTNQLLPAESWIS